MLRTFLIPTANSSSQTSLILLFASASAAVAGMMSSQNNCRLHILGMMSAAAKWLVASS